MAGGSIGGPIGAVAGGGVSNRLSSWEKSF